MQEAGSMRIDMHHHLLNLPNYAQHLVAEADRQGIDYICVSGLGLPSDNWLGDLSPTNDDVLRAMDAYPNRIIGFGVIRLGVDSAQTVEQLYAQGFRGIKTTRPLQDYDHSDYDEIYATAQQLRMPILFHTGITVGVQSDPVDNVSSARMRPVMLDRVARTFPNLTILMAHLGMPWYEEAAQMTRFHRNVYVDFSGSRNGWRNRKSPAFFAELFYWDGAFEKIVFGSDVHYAEIGESLADYERILRLNNVPAAIQRKVFGETMGTLLGVAKG